MRRVSQIDTFRKKTFWFPVTRPPFLFGGIYVVLEFLEKNVIYIFNVGGLFVVDSKPVEFDGFKTRPLFLKWGCISFPEFPENFQELWGFSILFARVMSCSFVVLFFMVLYSYIIVSNRIFYPLIYEKKIGIVNHDMVDIDYWVNDKIKNHSYDEVSKCHDFDYIYDKCIKKLIDNGH